MTAFAEIRRPRMRWRFSLGAPSIMAGETLLRRALETPVGVARRTLDAGMCAGERKSRREVIE